MRVRKPVPEQQVTHSGAHAPRAGDEVALAQFEQPGADHAGQHGPGEQRDHDDCGPRCLCPAIDASTSSRITGGSVMARSTRRMMAPSTRRPPKADNAHPRKADDERNRDRRDGDEQRDTAALHQPREDVAADPVGSEPVRGAWRPCSGPADRSAFGAYAHQSG